MPVDRTQDSFVSARSVEMVDERDNLLFLQTAPCSFRPGKEMRGIQLGGKMVRQTHQHIQPQRLHLRLLTAASA
jgi:hypothetical protein